MLNTISDHLRVLSSTACTGFQLSISMRGLSFIGYRIGECEESGSEKDVSDPAYTAE